MKIETVDGVRHIYFRQSWINTYQICPERARNEPTEYTDDTNEAAALGTAWHKGIETALSGNATKPSHVAEAAIEELARLEPLFDYMDLSPSQSRDWLRIWAPTLHKCEEFRDVYDNESRLVEQPFDIVIDGRNHGYEVLHLVGTIDAVHVPRYIVDWKTASRRYQAWERQRWAIQPTVYAEAASELGWVAGHPIEFRFVVWERNKSNPGPHVVKVFRGPEHTAHLTDTLWRVYDSAQAMSDAGLTRWPTNDQHALCSPKWCPVWANCKGAFIAPDFYPRG